MESMGITSLKVVVPPLSLALRPTLNSVMYQQTLCIPVHCKGIGVHSGKSATLTLRPAPTDTGYVFIRTDVPGHSRRIPAKWDTVTDTSMCTKITNAQGVSVSTIEHVIAALSGCSIHNALIEVSGPEVPIMDGSSSDFVELIHNAQPRQQQKMVHRIKVLKTVEVTSGTSSAILKPSDEAKFTMQFNANGRLANQSWSLTYYPDQEDFKDLLSAARTFGFYEDAHYLWSKGLAQGASLENTIVIKDGQVMNEEGLRFTDEFVRHKMLDAVGDFALAGAPIIGCFFGINSGHAINNQLLRTLFADESAWCIET